MLKAFGQLKVLAPGMFPTESQFQQGELPPVCFVDRRVPCPFPGREMEGYIGNLFAEPFLVLRLSDCGVVVTITPEALEAYVAHPIPRLIYLAVVSLS